MNIWILNHYAVSPDTPGGTRHYDLARELVKKSHEVTIFASGFSHRTRKEEKLETRQRYRSEDINGVRFVWVRTSAYYEGNNWRRALNMISYACNAFITGSGLKEKPDIIISSSPHPLTGLAGWLLAKVKKTKFIFEVRDLWPQTFIDIGGYSKRSPVVVLLKILEKFLYERANKIIVLLPEAYQYIAGRGINRNKIIYIPNGVSPELFAENVIEIPPQLIGIITALKSSGHLVVAYTGAHGNADGLETIIQAASLIQNMDNKVDFILVGDGPEKNKIMKIAADLNTDNVHFYPPIPKNAVPGLLTQMDIGVVTLKKSTLWKYGTSKNKILEYMMAAKPVVWAIDSVNNPVQESGCGITVSPENAEEMANAIIKMTHMTKEQRDEMGRRGRDYVMKYHSIPLLADKLLEVLKDA